MKSFRTVILSIIGALILSGFVVLLWQGVARQSQPIIAIDQSLITEITSLPVEVPTTYVTFDVAYPQFAGLDDLNMHIKTAVIAAVTNHAKSAEANWIARADTDKTIAKVPGTEEEKFPLSVRYTVAQANSRYVSLLMRISGFEGGAHGYESIMSFNYDVKKHQTIALKDLYQSDQNYLLTISDAVRPIIWNNLQTRAELLTDADKQDFKDSVMPMMNDGTEPTVENFNVFVFTDYGITFYFGQYQVAPYVFGEQAVTLPLTLK